MRNFRGITFTTKKEKAKTDDTKSNHNVRYLSHIFRPLSEELMNGIFQFLESYDLIDCVYVSKNWAKIIDDDERWKQSFRWQNENTIIVNDSWGQLPPERWKMKCTIRRKVLRVVSDGLVKKINQAFLENEFEYPFVNWREKDELHRGCLKSARKWGYDESNRVTEYWYLNEKMSYTGFVCGIYAEVSVNKFGRAKVFLDTGKGNIGIGDVSLSFVNEITYKMEDFTL